MKKFFLTLTLFFLFAPFFADDWYVCVGSFAFTRHATLLQQDLQKAGIASFVEPTFFEAGTCFYRVLIDERFPSSEKAETLLRSFKRSSFAATHDVSGAWICRLPSTPSTSKENPYISNAPKLPPEPVEKPRPILNTPKEVQNNDDAPKQKTVLKNRTDNFPNAFSDSVSLCLDQFPVNKDFEIESLQIFDMDNIRRNSKEYGETLLPEFMSNGAEKTVSAFSFATYKNKSSNKSVEIFVAVSDKSAFDVYYKDENLLESETDVSINYGALHSYIFKNDSGYLIEGLTKDQKLFVQIWAPNFSKEEFNDFIKNYKPSDSILVYPQVEKHLCVLPESNKREFLCFELEKIGTDYAKERDFVDWAMKAVGNWKANFYFEQKNEETRLGIFDFDSESDAKNAHEMFIADHMNSPETKENHPQTVKNASSWYLSNYTGNELSFPVKSYVIAIDSEPNSSIECAELTAFAEDLKIWE